ncbi:hypothetical protein CP965_09610 [Halarcobacter mediterraneus]|uniref:Uncharacterized protein n=1 Tax=Halarcobacter mediterraneus TaxID=2023153 RepID=A0A4Q1AVZ8_9BACT|nr:hypothetical protein [Halarcobacter mediterraneus]RXK12819.1 hypothetical protein CP965_09610 [Halarcobacter mediterraneus]
MEQIPLELISNFLSLIILIMIFVKYYQYKKKLEVLKKLDELKTSKKLTSEDKSFIKLNLKDYQILIVKDEQRLKLVYPVFILIAGILLAFLDFKEALIHLNVVIVAYILLQINKIHNKNFVSFLTELNKDLD